MAVIAGRGVGSGRAGVTNTSVDDIPSGSSAVNIGQREDLANFISMITRDETPFMSSIGKTKATAIYHEWQTDELNPPGDSKLSEGLDYVLPTGNPQDVQTPGSQSDETGTFGTQFNVVGTNRTRLGNYCQINGKSIAISGTRRVIDSAGVADEYAYQLKKRGTELRRDVEADLVNGQVSSASGSRRTMGGFMSWINDDRTVEYAGTVNAVGAAANATGAGRPDDSSGTNQQGIGTHVWAPATTVTNRGALSLSDMDQVMQNIYEQGGKAGKVMLSPKLRRDFSDLMVTDSGVRRNIDMDGKLRQSVDVYMSDFGDLMVMPNYIMGLESPGSVTGDTNNTSYKDAAAFVYDPQWFSMATLRPLQEVEVGQRGDSTIGMMVEEFTFEVKNPIGCGAIYNLR